MVLLPQSDIDALLNAVPSFQERWRIDVAERADFEKRFPKSIRSPEERVDDFLSDLAAHLGRRVAGGDLHEVEWLAAELERIFERVPVRTTVLLTVGFLESLVIMIEQAGGDASTVTPLMHGPRVRERWQQAYGYYHGEYLYDRAEMAESADKLPRDPNK
jgi:hypothetical protein